ncbi:MAG: DNA mismatch repair protein MutS [Clostridia bacterium]|nr:DNA mismatch repair protein MutS [Clostridia bacterium]
MALSPMMQHWQSVKDRYPDCIIFYRLGDFYEMFFDDAIKASKILDLVLTGRDCGLEDRAPMCGVPYHAVDSYLEKLVAAGEKVAICEQLEDPRFAKGMVDRDVIRVVTAGTVTSDSALDEKANNYICSACKAGDKSALCWADITTGDMYGCEFDGPDAMMRCLDEMVKLSVKEVICNDEMLVDSRDTSERQRILPAFSSYPEYAYKLQAAERTLKEQFKTQSLDSFQIAGKTGVICAAGALVNYLKDTQMHALRNIDDIKLVSVSTHMELDGTAVRNLEITRTLVDGRKKGSLLWLLDRTETSMGARLLSNLILAPSNNIDEINYRLDGVQELYDSTVICNGIKELLREIWDIERVAGKISNGNILPKDCLGLLHSLLTIPSLKFRLSGFTAKILQDLNADIKDLVDICSLLEAAIDPDCPATTAKGGYIKAGYNAELDKLRDTKKNAAGLLLDMETRERETTGIPKLKISYNRVFGYYIEVTKSFKNMVPDRYIRVQTLVGGERYTTPELKELEQQIVGSEDMALTLEEKLYEEIKATLADNIDAFKSISKAIAMLDVIVSFADLSRASKYVKPCMVPAEEPLIIKDGRHPVVEVISKEKFIPNDTLLDEGENRTMIITGPNMAGKSTYMRQTALICIMAHLGCFVPAKSAQIPVIDRVFTRVGASDNLTADQSTFMVEMIEVASILRSATRNSLLILDEVGRGTSTYDGLSIAWAVIENITREIGAKTLFATHYHELTALEGTIPGIKNYKVSVKEIGGQVVFLRKIQRGGASRSFGIEVAALAGVPEKITARAKEIMKVVQKGSKFVKNVEIAEGYAQPEESSAPEDESPDPDMTEILEILQDTDMDSLSPREAYRILASLVEKVKK